jgi:hypothetical protein
MNKNLLTLVFIASTYFLSFAQKSLSEGKIVMEISNVTSEDPQTAQMLEMMKGSQTEINFGKDGYSTKTSIMGGMVEVKTFTNTGSKQFDMLMDMMGQKMWIASNTDEMAKDDESKKVLESSKVVYNKEDKKVILGYNCYAMKLTTPENPDMTIAGYVTEEIKTNANIIQGFQAVKFDGFPMEYTVDTKAMKMTMSAKDIKDKSDAAAMVPKTDGYTKMTMEEFKQKMGGMGAGFGF